MASSITTSIRLSHELREALDQAARHLRRGRNSLITEALRTYLTSLRRQDLVDEARRQSLLASTRDVGKHPGDWEDSMDEADWH